MNKVTRNRLLVGLALAGLLACLVLVNHFYPFADLLQPKVEETPESIIESSGVADVVYYEAPETGMSFFAGDTPIVGIGMLYYPPTVRDADTRYHVELTPTGYKIVPGKYEWTPDTPEDDHHQFNVWNWVKWQYYHDNAMFRPGESERVQTALIGMGDRYAEKMLARLFYDIFRAAMMTEGDWNFIEIDMIQLTSPSQMLAVTEGEPDTAVVFPAMLRQTIVIYRARNVEHEEFIDGKWTTLTERRTIDDIVEEGYLEYDELNVMLETGQMQFVPGFTFFGMRSYNRGYNREWQGREIEIIRAMMAEQQQ